MTSVAAGPDATTWEQTSQFFPAYPLEAIRESPLNPRKHYDPAALQELADNLTTQGQITPAIVRTIRPMEVVSVDGQDWGVVEVAAGHRRLRALQLAGLTTMALVRREMDDAEFAEVLNIENLQRDNLHPLEEAQGFRALMEQAGYDIARLATRMGRDRSTIYDRLKLLQLIEPAQRLFLAGRFELGHAVLLARLSPSDQERAIESSRSGNGQVGGLFVGEAFGLFSAEEDDDLDRAAESDDVVERTRGMKPVSVRELQGWINRNVRFRPDEQDLPNLFPETAQALDVAVEEDLKVVNITREYRVPDEARDENQRTYGEQAWKRADGETEPNRFGGKPTPGKTCEHAVMGVVVAGFGRGEAFKVCIAKKRCKVHWGKEMRESAKAAKARESGAATSKPARKEVDWQEQQRLENVERGRWEKAKPAVLVAVAEKLPTMNTKAIGAMVLKAINGHRGATAFPKVLEGAEAEQLLRQALYLVVAGNLNPWSAAHGGSWATLLKPFGIDPNKIRDQVAPSPKAEKAAEAEKSTAVLKSRAPAGKKKAMKKLAGDVRRAAAKKKAAAKQRGVA